MKILVFGVIYPGVEKYLDDYFKSLDIQTYSAFDIIIIQDRIKLPNKYLRKNLTIIESKENSTPAEIRFLGIEFAKNKNYDIMIFTDCDDYFSRNRIEKTIQSLKRVDFCVNRLITINETGNIIEGENSMKVPSHLTIAEILNTNYFGMSNTALNIRDLPKHFYIPADLIAVDWWVYTILLLNSKIYLYDYEVITYYRQHDNNIIGINTDLMKAKLFSGVRLKLAHYKNLLIYCNQYGFPSYKSVLMNFIEDFEMLEKKLKNENFLISYISVINKNKEEIRTGWWSEILTINEWCKYA